MVNSSGMIKRFILMLIAALAIFGGIAGFKVHQIKQLAAQFATPAPPTNVAAVVVEAAIWERSLFAIGSLVAVQDVEVTNEVAGLVESIRFESGQRVAAGDVLVTLDTSVDRAELNGLVAAQRLREVEFARAARLLKDQTLSQSQHDEAAARRAETTALVLAKEARIAKKTIRAPFAGQLGIRKVDLGDYLAPGSPMVPLQTLAPIFVDYTLPERFLAKLELGQRVRVRVQAYPAEEFDGTIAAIEPGIDPVTRAVKVRATLENADARLRPGMFAEVDTLEDARDTMLTLPETAISYSPYGNSVFLVEAADGVLQVRRRQVETGEVRDGKSAITKGLAAGDRVVSVGHNKLRNGMAVRVVADPPEAPAEIE